MSVALISALVVALVLRPSDSWSPDHYVAAVYEHARLDNFSSTPMETVWNNLEHYYRAAEMAATKGADIIVFPEYGIFPPGNRTQMKNFLEDIPDPKEVRADPCHEIAQFSDRPILRYLSCIAKAYSLVVVANTGDIKRCREGEEDCPEDGDWHYNTNVAFDSDGTLVGRYHKERLFFEAGMDLPKVEQDPTFDTSFGKFAMFVCFDVVFQKITEVAKRQDVEAVLLPTMWIDPSPLMWSVQLWQAWAMGNNATFMAANVQMPGYSAVGSGIFRGNDGPLAYTFNPDGRSKLIVAHVPRRHKNSTISSSSITAIAANGTEDYAGDGNRVPEECSKRVLNDSTDIRTDYRCLEEDTSNYTFVKLQRSAGRVEACNNGMCCALDYAASDMREDYYLGVYNGTYNMFDRYFWWQENCLLVRCDAFGDNPCATFPMRSKTKFRYISLMAEVSTEHVYPSMVASGMRLVPAARWRHRVHDGMAYVYFRRNRGMEILVAGINGRSYRRDPPYIR